MDFFYSIKKGVFLLLGALLVLSNDMFASHAASGHITYTSLGANQYRVTVTYYRDKCGSAIAPSTALNITNGTTNSVATLTVVGPNAVAPLCQAVTNNTCTSCGGTGTLSCFEAYTMSAVVTLAAGATWTLSWSENARNSAISNLVNPGGASLFLRTVINTTSVSNNNSASLPRASLIYACLNNSTIINPRITDVDGDVLEYALDTTKSALNTNMTFVAPYSYANPLGTPTDPFNIDPTTGLITFTPRTIGNFVFTVRIRERRNGVVISTVYRDYQVQVMNTGCNGNEQVPVTPSNPSVNNGAFSISGGVRKVKVCAGSVVSFRDTLLDPDAGDVLRMTRNTLSASGMTGATISTTGQNPLLINFSWNTTGANPGVYNFVVVYEDNACPEANKDSLTYQIEVARLRITPSTYFICDNNPNTVQFNADLEGSTAPGTFRWSPSTGLSSTTISNPVANVSSPITYMLTYTEGPCTQTSTVALTAPNSVYLPTIPDGIICNGGSQVINAGVSMPALYSFSNSTTSTIVAQGSNTSPVITNIPITVTGLSPSAWTNGYLNSVCVNISQNLVGHLILDLVSPSGQIVNLASQRGASGTGYSNVCFNMSATTLISSFNFFPITANGTFRPEGNLTTGYSGLANVNGVWNLRVTHTGSSGNGGTNGVFRSITLNFNNLLSPSYTWSQLAPSTPVNITPLNTASVTATPSQTTRYRVIARNVVGCLDTAEVTVFVQPNMPTPSVTCASSTRNSVTFQWPAVSGVGSFQVSTTGPSGPFINVGTNTTYTISGLTVGQTATLNVWALPPTSSSCSMSAPGSATCTAGACATITPTISGVGHICSGANRTLTGQSGFTTYAWSNAQSTSAVIINTGGVYQLTVTDADGCTGTNSVTVTSSSPSVQISGRNRFCPNSSTSLTATTGFNQYLWGPNGEFTNQSVASAAGTYTVTVTDANGCTATNAITVTADANPTPTISGSTSICNGASTLLDAGLFTSFEWSNSGTTRVITAITPNVYNVTVTDANGCTGSTSTTVTLSSGLTPQISPSGPLTFCRGGRVTLDPGAFDSYSWSTVTNTRVLTATTSGVYSVTVSNVNGCTGVDVVTVTVNALPTVQASNSGPYCAGTTITLSALGATNYSWSGPNAFTSLLSNPSIVNASVSQSGVYTVVGTDDNGCSASAVTTVTVNPLPVLNVTATQAGVYCFGSTVLLTATGGDNYTWSGPNGFTLTASQGVVSITNASPANGGVYNVTATTALGCSATSAITVTVSPELLLSINGSSSICINSIATLDAVIVGGTSPYSFRWNTGPTTQQLTAQPTAAVTNYCVTVTDALGCAISKCFNVSVTNQLIPNLTTSSGRTGLCQNELITVNAGVFNSYQWSTGASTSTITVNIANVYVVTVSDVQGCTGTGSITVTNFAQPVVSLGADRTICTNATVTLTAQINGTGTAPFQYNWDNGLSQGNVQSVSPTLNTMYNVTVTDANSCTSTDVIALNISAGPFVNLGNDFILCAGLSRTLIPAVTQGVAPYSYSWSNALTTASQAVSPTTDASYTLVVTDNIGCTATDLVNITISYGPTVTLKTNTNRLTFCDNSNITILCETTFNSYNWSTGATTQNITVNQGGVYRLTVTDNGGCPGFTAITVTKQLPIRVTARIDSVYCKGGADGQAHVVTVSGGNGIFTNSSYQWSNGQSGVTATGLRAGRFIVVASDSDGCTASTSVNVLEPVSAVTNVILASDATCFNQNNGSALCTTGGGTKPYTYLWSDGATTNSRNDLKPLSQYYITTTDARGCSRLDSVLISQPLLLRMLITRTSPTSCSYTKDGTASLGVSGGTLPYRFQWSNGETTRVPTALPSGLNSVVIIDNYGCQVSSTLTIASPAPLELAIDTLIKPLCFGSATGSIEVQATGGSPIYSFVWDAQTGNQTDTLAENLPNGLYFVTVTDAKGCRDTMGIVLQPATQIRSSIVQDSLIKCFGDSTAVAHVVATGGAPTYQYIWTTGSTLNKADSLYAGIHNVTITDQNGCTHTNKIEIKQPTKLTITAQTTPVKCQGGTEGAINLVQSSGGTQPYQYAFNNRNNWQVGSNKGALRDGSYMVYMRDFNKCLDSSRVAISTLSPGFKVNAGINDTIEYGTTTNLQGTTTAAAPYTVLWSPSSNLTCADCLNPTANPTIPTNYILQITDAFGCSAQDTVLIDITTQRRVFIATLFSPNGDTRNDLFLVQGGLGVEKVNTFKVFDRWGEMVYENTNFVPNTVGWDGTFKGENMNSGVYMWYAEIQYTDGYKEVLKGDVTLIR